MDENKRDLSELCIIDNIKRPVAGEQNTHFIYCMQPNQLLPLCKG